jgi:hypothetical protein
MVQSRCDFRPSGGESLVKNAEKPSDSLGGSDCPAAAAEVRGSYSATGRQGLDGARVAGLAIVNGDLAGECLYLRYSAASIAMARSSRFERGWPSTAI